MIIKTSKVVEENVRIGVDTTACVQLNGDADDENTKLENVIYAELKV